MLALAMLSRAASLALTSSRRQGPLRVAPAWRLLCSATSSYDVTVGRTAARDPPLCAHARLSVCLAAGAALVQELGGWSTEHGGVQ